MTEDTKTTSKCEAGTLKDETLGRPLGECTTEKQPEGFEDPAAGLDKAVDERYSYVKQKASKGKDRGKVGNLDEVLNTLIKYENRKLKALSGCPEFNKEVERLRRSMQFSTNLEVGDRVNLMSKQTGYLLMSSMNKPFFETLCSLMTRWGLSDGEAEYVVISYYLLFGILVDGEHLAKLCGGLPASMRPFVIPDALNKVADLLRSPSFQQDVCSSREQLGIRPPTFPEDIAYNHAHFFHLATQYLAQSDALYRGIYNLLVKYPYLNPQNPLDYSLMFGYIAWSEGVLSIARVKDFFGNGLPLVKTGKDILGAGGAVGNNIYIELQPFSGSAYLRDILAYISSEVRLVRDYVDAGKMQEDYYIVEHSYYIEDLLKRSDPSLRKAKLMEMVLAEMDNEYGRTTSGWDTIKLKKRRKSCAWLKEQFAMGKRLP